MKFKYIRQPFSVLPNKPYISRPEIPVRIWNQQKFADIFALVDSGADISMFHSDIAKDLGVDLSHADIMTFSGIAEEEVTAYITPVELNIIGLKTTILIPVAFTDSNAVDAILGQVGFFEHYEIKFQKYNERLEIKPRPKA